jgi:hypothetical protein
MVNKRDPFDAGKERARKIKPKTEESDRLASERMHAGRNVGTREEIAKRERMHRGKAQFSRFKKVSDHYESKYTGIMLCTVREFDTFSEFFRDGEMKIEDIQCRIDEPFKGCKTLKDVRDVMSGEGKAQGKTPMGVNPRKKHQFEWTVILSDDQMKALKASYERDLGTGAGGVGGGGRGG